MSIREVYKLTSPSGKCYIGQTKNGHKTRFKQHQLSWKKWVRGGRIRNGGCVKLYYAFDTYDPSEWEIEVIFRSSNLDDINKKEALLIEEFNAINDGYNIIPGGGGKDKKVSLETRKNMSKARLEFYKTERGQKDILERSERMIGNQYGAGHTGWLKGKKVDDIVKEKISRTLKENWANASEEVKNRKSQETKQKWVDGVFDNRPPKSREERLSRSIPFKITHPTGEVEEVTLLSEWCDKMGFDLDSTRSNFDSSGKYRGYIAERLYNSTKRKQVRSDRVKNKISKSVSKTWTIKTPCGSIEVVRSLKEWCKMRELVYSNVQTNLSARGKYKGYHLIDIK